MRQLAEEKANGPGWSLALRRRWLLVAGCAALLATLAPERARGAAETELEGAAYAGQSTGRWTCGPQGEAHYAGLGGQVRVSQRPAREGQGRGGTVIAGAAVERETVDVRPTSGSNGRGRLNAAQGGAGLRGGYDWQYFGFQLGVQSWSAWASYDDSKLTGFWLPQAELRAGPQQRAWFKAGFGSPLVTAYRRPGGYLGAGLKLDLHEIDAFLGSYRAGASGFDDSATRFDLVWKFPAWRGWGPRIGGSLSDPHESSAVDWEASLGVAALL